MPWPHIARISLTGAALSFLTLWFHAFWVFGVALDYLNGGRQPMAPGLPVTTRFFAELAFLPALLTGFGLTVVLAFTRHRPVLQRGIALPAWLILWFLSADFVATQFAIDFGTTWGFAEPFGALMAHDILTPACLLAGLTALWCAFRSGNPCGIMAAVKG